MHIFVQPTQVSFPKSKLTHLLSLGLVAFFVIIAVAQLFKYESFPDVITGVLPGLSTQSAHLVAALIVTGEVLALPFLLGMYLSPAMRVLSMLLGWLVIGGWLALSLIALPSTGLTLNSGVLGAVLSVPAGWWMVVVFLIAAVVMGVVSRALWPLGHGRTTKRTETTVEEIE